MGRQIVSDMRDQVAGWNHFAKTALGGHRASARHLVVVNRRIIGGIQIQ